MVLMLTTLHTPTTLLMQAQTLKSQVVHSTVTSTFTMVMQAAAKLNLQV